ncbi:ADP-ribosylglycohydrolase family protein [Microbacterium sp. MPKO10]|uniref:ADP-ribosylglycohydrolase family protein n=1 Tax=Microbacterium sp. MPKO10 TaxID=2989818 RepID=UPI00223645A7|nr:ADP-ribosylglycohydrolase family protein [Microbacterium sp. MPKO10]MCW4459792.1 ADP-ribosylglycohydrolase family protein [Microbacterium sp. MPKO10]
MIASTLADEQQAAASRLDRAHGALLGLALGDALGMPTQSMSPDEIAEDYGSITQLIDAGPRQMIAHGMPAGSITDDTEQALLLAQLVIDGDGRIDERAFATALIDWERAMEAKGSLDLLGPSTKRAVERILDGVPASESGRFGATNGAAMRVAPIGVAAPAEDLHAFIDTVVEASAVTHNTSLGIASASAIGAAVSVGVDGGTRQDAVDTAIAAARLGDRRGHWVAGGSIASRIEWASDLLQETPVTEHPRVLRELVGTSVASQESVVAAVALVAVSTDPWQTLCLASNLGGDTDTIAAMAGAVLGAVHGASIWPADPVQRVLTMNALELEPVAQQLLALRTS